MEQENVIVSDKHCLKASPIFYATMGCAKRGIIHQGGQSSGKTVNILAVLAVKAAQEQNRIITVTAKSLPNLKRGALRDFEMYILPHFKHQIANHNKTDNIFVFKSGSLIEFKSFESEQDARGAKRDYLFVNEANSFDFLTFHQLHSRTNIQSIIDYNPSAPFWAHDKLHGRNDWQLFISDHRHNPFLSPDKHAEIESYEGELFRVYARGLTGNIKGVIFPDWQVIPHNELPKNSKPIFGIDYGYTNDPTALVKVWIVGKKIYVDLLCYKPAVTSENIKELLQLNGHDDMTPVYSEHDKLYVSELRRMGLRNIILANKKQGSLINGIRKLKEYRVFYTDTSDALHEELKKYIWKTDIFDNPINEPIDKFNHAIDAIRYAVYTHYFR